ncbi:MnmC family methyltransferase [Arcobacteraceae bacterium]|nr:MnmC family methyltransferase [Arcobacteraceae bacterium]
MGYNTLATLYYIKLNNLKIKVNIYTPEFDRDLLDSLKDFKYPLEFKDFGNIIKTLSSDLVYQSDTLKIEIFNGDARDYIKHIQNIDIVYQDAFSSDVNHSLWTVEYFKDIKKALSHNAIMTTYSIATPIRLSIYENDFTIYEYKPDNSNRITIALNKKEIDTKFKHIDMEVKKQRNTTALPLYD